MNRVGKFGARAALAAAAFATGAQAQFIDPLIPGELMVRVTAPTRLAECLAALQSTFAGVAVIDAIESRQCYLMSYSLGRGQTTVLVEDALLQLVATNTIVWGELNYEGQASEGKTGSLWVSQLGVGAAEFGGQYAVPLLGLPTAHERSTGFGVVVAVLDTGVDATHPILVSSVLDDGANFVGTGAPTTDVGDNVDNDGDGLVDEMTGHGTFVAGLIALTAPDARVLPITVLNSDGIGSAFNIAKGVYWAIDHGADVVNMSLGSTYHAAIIEDAVIEASTAGVFVTGAAGNFDVSDPREYPACDNAGFGVAALDRVDRKAPFSNYEEKLDFSAPGHSETMPRNPALYDPTKSIISSVPGGGYAIWHGTSFATAFVSGCAALVRAQYPGWPDASTPLSSIAPTIALTLSSTSVPIDALNPAYKGQLGAGRVDAAAATLAGPMQPVPGDLDGDGVVSAADLAILLGAWGSCSGPCGADFDFNGTVDASDLAFLLGAWN